MRAEGNTDTDPIRARDALSPYALTDQVVVVTGGASGIGRSTVETAAALGALVVCGDLDLAAAEATVRHVTAGGGVALAAEVDVRSSESVKSLVAAAVGAFDRLDGFVNNAGTTITASPMEFSEADFDQVIAINLKGVLFGCQAAARVIEPTGSIVNVASSVIDGLEPDMLVYAASKAGVVQLTRGFAKALGPRGVRVNTVAPGWVETPITQKRFLGEDGQVDPERRATFVADRAADTLINRVGTASDVAHLVTFLLSDAAAFCTGNVYRVNGGRHLAG